MQNFSEITIHCDFLETDYSQCGQAGDVGSVRNQARIRRAVGGVNAATRAWPWHVVISLRRERLFEVCIETNLVLGS